jgi:Streptomyces sporulation and cell division protein, SsgA
MIGYGIRQRLLARPVGPDGQLAHGSYIELLYAPDVPYEVRIAQLGPYAYEVAIARDLLKNVLDGKPPAPDEVGEVTARLAYLPRKRRSMVLLAVGQHEDERWVVALSDTAVAAFVHDTRDLVPIGEESEYLDLDDDIRAILDAA